MRITLDHQKLMTLIDNEKFYSSIIKLDRRRQEAGRDRQGPADAPGAQRHRARRPAARGGDREDPHPPADPLQGRSRFAGREVAGRRGLAPHRRRRSLLPAEGSAGVHRARSLADGAERVEAPVGSAAAGRRHDPGDRQGRTPWSSRSIRRVRKSRNRPPKSLPRRLPKALLLPAEGAAAAGAKAGDAKAAAGDAKGALPRLPRRRKAARSNGSRVRAGASPPASLSTVARARQRRAISSARRCFVSRTMAGHATQTHRRARQSGRRVRAHAPQRGLLARGRAGAPPRRHVPPRRQAPGASSRACASAARSSGC